jgi:predicted GTPase
MEGYNLAIIGKSGVGKSSLLNYLFNKELAVTGSGKPVTKQGFHIFSDSIAGKKVNIYDSWGMEPGKTDIWLKDFNDFLKDKKSLNIKEWIHTVVFCLSAEGKRIEDFEKKIFAQIKAEHLNPIIVITKADLDKDNSFYEAVKREFMTDQIIEICSVKKQFGLGSNKKVSERYGNDNLVKAIIDNGSKSFKNRFILIKNQFVKQRANEGVSIMMPKVEIIIDANKESSNLLGNIKDSTVKSILEKTHKLVQSYDKETATRIEKLLQEANLFYSNHFLFVMGDISQKRFKMDNEDKSSFLLLPPLLSMGGVLGSVGIITLFSALLGPLGLLISIFINKGISKENLLDKIEISINEHYTIIPKSV